jgi:hypothetical protein
MVRNAFCDTQKKNVKNCGKNGRGRGTRRERRTIAKGTQKRKDNVVAAAGRQKQNVNERFV